MAAGGSLRVMATTKPLLYLSGDPKADKLLSSDPFALLVGMVLDQQVPLEWAFSAPALLNERLGRKADAKLIAGMDPDELATIFRGPPALHRFPGSMAARVRDLAVLVVSEYGGNPTKIWSTATTGAELLRRVEALPGFGKAKAKIFVALLGKQFGTTPPGWREASAPFGEPGTHMSVADINSPATLQTVREHKRQMKAARKAEMAAQG